MGNILKCSSTSCKQTLEQVMFSPPDTCSYSIHHERLYFVSGIAYMHYHPKKRKNQFLILHSHGNACEIGHMDRFLMKLFEDLGNVDIISYDYEGYGLTKGLNKTPTIDGCIRSIDSIYNHAISMGYRPEHIILYGVSIGTGPSVDLAARKPIHSMLLQSPYTSIIGVGSPCVETTLDCLYIPNAFPSLTQIPNIRVPITILHGTNDKVIPYEHAVKLQNANPIYVILYPLENATHNNIETDYYCELRMALQTLTEIKT